MLGLKFDRETESGRASQLCKRLMKEKILVILDDIWGRLDLEAVGIPLGDNWVHHKEQMVPLKMAGNSIEDPNKVSEIKGCKVLLTSRNQDVLYNQMDTQKKFEIGVLLEQGAWNLFKKMVGDCIEDPDLQPTAIEVAKTCACLPIAIVTITKALKNKSLLVWKDALQQLHRSNPTNIMGMHADVYSSLELSYI
ncbi:hypothetical protein L1049_019998 [Liquidambar formosana]|uniref:NB-ARC domain-containing protein n=1 Tax=Liquidambar formosana TaxID=63359 RepID=A0AAP0X3C4_LIQFO